MQNRRKQLCWHSSVIKRFSDSLEEHGIVHSAELVREMKVSSETVRKDLDALEQSGKLKRVHGGAVPISQMPAQNGQYISLKTRNSSCMEEKAAIAAYAAGLVREHQAVGLDYGSTSLVMAKELVRRFEHLTVVTIPSRTLWSYQNVRSLLLF